MDTLMSFKIAFAWEWFIAFMTTVLFLIAVSCHMAKMLHIYKLSTFNLAPHLSLHLYYKIMLNHINHDSDTHPKGFDSSTYSCQWMYCTYMCCQWYACQVNWWERDHIYMKEARMTRTLGQWTGGIHEKWPMNITYNVLHHQWTNFNTVNICWKKSTCGISLQCAHAYESSNCPLI